MDAGAVEGPYPRLHRVEKRLYVPQGIGGQLRPFLFQKGVDVLLRLPDGHGVFQHLTQDLPLLLLPRQPQQGPGVALRQTGAADLLQKGTGQPEKPQLVGGGGLGHPHPSGRLLLAHPELRHQAVEPLRLLEKIQLPVLQILHQRQDPALPGIRLEHHTGHLRQTRQPGRPEAALPGDQPVPRPLPPDGERLQDPVPGYAVRQLPDLLKPAAGIVAPSDRLRGEIRNAPRLKRSPFSRSLHLASALSQDIWSFLSHDIPYIGNLL